MSAPARSITPASATRWALMALVSAGWLAFLIVTCVIALTLPAVIIAPILGFFTLSYCIAAIVLAASGSRSAFCSAYTELALAVLHFFGWLALGVYYAIFSARLADEIYNAGFLPDHSTATWATAQNLIAVYQTDRSITIGLAVETFILAILSAAWIGLLVFRAARVQGTSTAQALKTPVHFLMTGEIESTPPQGGKEFMMEMEEPSTETAAGSSYRIV